MTTIVSRRAGQPTLGLLRDLDRPSQVFAHLTPNWFAAVMGTGIVAVAGATLHLQFPGLHRAAIGMWLLAAALFVTLVAATAVHWTRHPATARSHVAHPVAGLFYGAPPMAALTVGAGTLLLGRDVIGMHAALAADWALWFAGTAAGLVTAVVVPYVMVTRQRLRVADAFGGWLMPVVPPMVSASTGALLVPHTPVGSLRPAMLLACYALFGLALVVSAAVIAAIAYRLAVHGVGEAKAVPTLWIVLGPLGQSVTAATLLGGVAPTALPPRAAAALLSFGVAYGFVAWGLSLVWAGVAATVTVQVACKHLPFGLTWWSFTFPVGTVVTGTTGLAAHTGSTALAVVAAGLFAGLVAAWLTVFVRTAQGAFHGWLFLAPNIEEIPDQPNAEILIR